jgi:uncharacterized protein YkwD
MDLSPVLACWLVLVNADRAAAGAAPLVWDPALAEVARWRGEDLAARGALDHQLPHGASMADVLANAGVSYAAAGENLGRCWCGVAPLERALVESPAHRAQLLGPAFGRIGLAVAAAPDGRLYYVQLFAD